MATLLKTKMDYQVDDDIKEYVANSSVCRRDALFGNMDNYRRLSFFVKCLCCDVCGRSCQCGSCESNLDRFSLFSLSFYMYLNNVYSCEIPCTSCDLMNQN